jgi:hypothetical protein
MNKKLWVSIIIFFLIPSLFSEVSLTKYYPKILSLNNDGQNDFLFVRYKNDEGKKIKLKIYDINNVVVCEENITGSQQEWSEGDEYIFKCLLEEKNFAKEKLLPGPYIFVLTADEQQVIGKGVFVVVK